MDRVRVALVGYGYWGPNLARNFHQLPSTELTYVVDANPAAQERARSLYHCATAGDLREVLEGDRVEAVVIATPARTHFALAEAALLAGKHVLVEKPLTMDLEEGRRLTALAASRGLTLMVGHVFEFNPAVRYIKRAIDAGELGDLYYLYGACAGYLVAVADVLPDGRACLPTEGTVLVIEDAMDAVVAAPEVAGETGPALAERMLAETYPC